MLQIGCKVIIKTVVIWALAQTPWNFCVLTETCPKHFFRHFQKIILFKLFDSCLFLIFDYESFVLVLKTKKRKQKSLKFCHISLTFSFIPAFLAKISFKTIVNSDTKASNSTATMKWFQNHKFALKLIRLIYEQRSNLYILLSCFYFN